MKTGSHMSRFGTAMMLSVTLVTGCAGSQPPAPSPRQNEPVTLSTADLRSGGQLVTAREHQVVTVRAIGSVVVPAAGQSVELTSGRYVLKVGAVDSTHAYVSLRVLQQ